MENRGSQLTLCGKRWGVLYCFFLSKNNKSVKRASIHNRNQLIKTLARWKQQPIEGSNQFGDFSIERGDQKVVCVSIVGCDTADKFHRVGLVDGCPGVTCMLQFPDLLIEEVCKYPFSLFDLLSLGKYFESFVMPVSSNEFPRIAQQMLMFPKPSEFKTGMVHSESGLCSVNSVNNRTRTQMLGAFSLFQSLKLPVDFESDHREYLSGSISRESLQELHDCISDLSSHQLYKVAETYDGVVVASDFGKNAVFGAMKIGSCHFAFSTSDSKNFKKMSPMLKDVIEQARVEGAGMIFANYMSGATMLTSHGAPNTAQRQISKLLDQLVN